jgi:hypothetical protein
MGIQVHEATRKINELEEKSDEEVLELAREEIRALCGGIGVPKKWMMSIPVDAERDSDVIFGEVLKRFKKLIEARDDG